VFFVAAAFPPLMPAGASNRVPGRRADELSARLTLLGGFELAFDGHVALLPQPAQRLLAFLALQNHAVDRIYVAGTLWLNVPEDRAFGSLRSALWRLRRLDIEVVEATARNMRLAPSVTVDAREAAEWSRRILDGTSRATNAPLDDGILQGELLPDWYDDWVLIERERLRELQLHALEVLCEGWTQRGRFAQAMDAALAAVRLEPLRESAHRLLIKVHLAEGNEAAALRHYQLYRRQLRDELDLEPSRQMDALVRAVFPR
jgi:DNA-binding SARP family transcriptional activator